MLDEAARRVPASLGELPFAVEAHPDVAAPMAQAALRRIRADMAKYRWRAGVTEKHW